jgi:hypothetical protein
MPDTNPQTKSVKKKRRKPGRPRVEQVCHIIEILSWDLDYMFGLDSGPFAREPYLDSRHINIVGRLIRPTSLSCTNIKATCFPDDWLLASARKDNKPKGVGYISYWGKDYSANLHLPSDLLGPVLQMMIAEKYRYIIMEAHKPFRGEAVILNYRFSATLHEDDLSPE